MPENYPARYDNNIYREFPQSRKAVVIKSRLPYYIAIRYNSQWFCRSRGPTEIKNQRIFSTIRDINETLSLTNEPDKLIDMALDTLSRVLNIECCWIQTINLKKQTLSLAASRGFNRQIKQEMASVDISHSFGEQVIGLGHKIVIPNLSSDGVYGLSSFRAAGYKWLVAVPLMTYRVQGVLGIASRQKRRYHKEFAGLAMVVASLIGTALDKARLSRKSTVPEERVTVPREETDRPAKTTDEPPPAAKKPSDGTTPPPEKQKAVPGDDVFHKHARKMEKFRRSHR